MERQLPALAPAPKVVYTVKFKRSQRNFITGPRVTRDLDIGCYVKVEADRGEDLGIIVSKIQNGKVSGSGRGSSRDLGTLPGMGIPSTADLKRIIRVATHDEVSLLAVKRQEEEELLNICRTKVRQRALPMKVIDAEYQFDRHKLTFFFEAEGRIDFRELVRDLFSMYKTRIWMQQLDKTPALTTAGGIEYGTSPPEHIESMENLGRPGMSN
jgi:cell fate regulator YaaT (PSP1 superfamily)